MALRARSTGSQHDPAQDNGRKGQEHKLGEYRGPDRLSAADS